MYAALAKRMIVIAAVTTVRVVRVLTTVAAVVNSLGGQALTIRRVTIFTTPTCQYCKMAKAFFKAHAVAYQEKDVTTDARAGQMMMELSGQLGTPVISITDRTAQQVVVGFQPDKLSRLLGLSEK